MKQIISLFISLVIFSSCSPIINNPASESDKFSTTTWGAITGTAVGAGLGLLIGAASGNAGEGFILGSLGGAATGGIVGSKLEEKERVISNQKDALEQHRNGGVSKEREIFGIKRQGKDNFAVAKKRKAEKVRKNYAASNQVEITEANRSSKTGRTRLLRPSRPEAPQVPTSVVAEVKRPIEQNRLSVQKTDPTSNLNNKIVDNSKEKDLPLQEKPVSVKTDSKLASGLPPAKTEIVEEEATSERARLSVEEPVVKTETTTAAKKNSEKRPSTSGCVAAESEASRARISSTDADKLFYYRRALRLCPNEPRYNVEMGKIFGAIGRTEEARTQFENALKTDPSNAAAKYEIKMLKLDNAY